MFSVFKTYCPSPLAWLCAVVLVGLVPVTASAQNPGEPPDPDTKVPASGPAGVGNSDGSNSQQTSQPQNALWLRADEGVTTNSGVTEWADQSGNGNTATPPVGRPTLVNSFSGFGGAAAINFDPGNNELFEVAENSDLDNTDELTIFSVFYSDVFEQNNSRGILGKRFDFDDNNARNDDQYAYSQFLWRSDELYLDIPDNGNRISSGGFSANTAYNFQGWYDSASDSRMYVNGNQEASTGASGSIGDEPSKLRIGILKNGQEITDATNDTRFFDGKIGEVIVYRTALNEAQRTIVNSYLANKYSLPTTGTEVQNFAFGGSFSTDFAGIGRATSSDTHPYTNSSVLGLGVGSEFEASGFGADGRYIFVGHDGGGPSDFTTASFSKPVSGRTDAAARIDRTWRADFAGFSSAKAVTVTIKSDSLPAKPSASDSYFLITDQGSSFDTAPEAYKLTDDDSDGDLTATVELEDGDFVAIGAGQRAVNFTATSGSGFENNVGTTSITAKLNLPYTASGNSNVDGQGTTVDVGFTDTGDIASPSGIQDDGFNQSGSNDNGDFEADDGSGNDSASDGSFAGDYRVNTGSPVTISAGNREKTIDLEIDNDGLGEQTEKFEVALDAGSTTNAILGSDDRFLFSINDDDLDRDLTIVSGDDGNSKTETDSDFTESFTVELDQDGNGETAASSSPYTSVEFVVDEANSDATPGTDLSKASVDFKIVDESGSGGSEFQERLSSTRGRVNFASGARSAELKLKISGDGVNDADTEDIEIDLVSPVSAVLSQSPGNIDLIFTINDDDSPPTVQFAQSSSEGDESTNGSVEVTLDKAPGRTVTVDYSVDAGNSSATEGASDDFTTAPTNPDTVQFAAGETSRFITVNVNDDSEAELDETVELVQDNDGDAGSSPTVGATWGGTTSHTYTISDNDDPAIGTTGPGGVGAADGSGKLALWLRADEISLEDGDPVGTWPDSSGRGNDATASGSARPTYRTDQRNGRATVEFDGSDTRMTGAVTRGFEATYFGVGNASNNNRPAMAEVHDAGNPTRNILFLRDGGSFNYYNSGSGNTGGSLSSSRYFLFDVTHDAVSTIRGYDGGDEVVTNTSADPNQSVDSYVIGDDRTSGDHLDGNVGEFIVFGKTLNDTRRILIENYLSAKYNVGLKTGGSAKDVYAGDQGGNGDYDRGVFGIGSESSDDFHSAAESDGLRFKVSGGLDAGDYLMAGHRTAGNSVNDSDVSGVSSLKARSERAWYVDVTDPGGDLTVNVTVKLAQAGLSESAGDAGNYVLLERAANTTNAWTAIQNGADGVSEDEISFNSISLTDGQEVTIGTTDRLNSPLGGARIVLKGTDGNEGSVNDINPTGGDAGWVTLGPPETGGTFGGLASDTDPQLIEFDLPGPMIYTYDSINSQWEEVPGSQSGVTVPNGKGFLLYVFDDIGSPDSDPVDPTLPITVSDGNGAPTTDQTVSIEAGAEQWLFMANPFDVPFDLAAISTSGGSGVQAVAQVYDRKSGYTLRSLTAPTDTIGVGQGFFLECSTNNDCPGSVTLQASGRVTGDRSVVGYKSRSTERSEQLASMSFGLTVENGGDTVSTDRTAKVLFYEEAENGWDRYDATKLAPLKGSYAALAPLAQVDDSLKRMGQAGLPWPQTMEPVEVPLEVTSVGVSGTATVRMQEVLQAEGWNVELVDTKGTADPSDDHVHQMSVEGDGYRFQLSNEKAALEKASVGEAQSIASDSATARRAPQPKGLALSKQLGKRAQARTAATLASGSVELKGAGASTNGDSGEQPPTRLVLRITPPSSALPVELSDLTAQQDGGAAVIRWQTTSETNNAGFYVEHRRLPADTTTAASTDSPERTGAEDWRRLGFVEGMGTTTQPQSYRYRTESLEYGRHAFRLRQVDTDGTEVTTDRVTIGRRLKAAYALEAPYPNPTRRGATLPVTVRQRQRVSVRIYDVMGRRVRTVWAGEVPGQETQEVHLSTENLASGQYFLRIRGEDFVETERLTVVR